MAQDALALVLQRNLFYRDNYRRIVLVLLLALLINLFLAGILVYMVTHPPKPVYFATSINGRITPLTALDEPNQSDSAVLQWAYQAAIASFSYNFVNYRNELQAASEFFTPNGWTEFTNALQQSNNLKAMIAKNLISSATATSAPIVLRKGLIGDRYAWRVQMPILVTYQSASEIQQERNVVTMLITRVSTLNSPRGIGIEQMIVQPAEGGAIQ